MAWASFPATSSALRSPAGAGVTLIITCDARNAASPLTIRSTRAAIDESPTSAPQNPSSMIMALSPIIIPICARGADGAAGAAATGVAEALSPLFAGALRAHPTHSRREIAASEGRSGRGGRIEAPERIVAVEGTRHGGAGASGIVGTSKRRGRPVSGPASSPSRPAAGLSRVELHDGRLVHDERNVRTRRRSEDATRELVVGVECEVAGDANLRTARHRLQHAGALANLALGERHRLAD